MPSGIQEILRLLTRTLPEGDEEMNSEFDFYDIYTTEVDADRSGIPREMISQLITAGILFPDEVRYAEQILRRLNKKSN